MRFSIKPAKKYGFRVTRHHKHTLYRLQSHRQRAAEKVKEAKRRYALAVVVREVELPETFYMKGVSPIDLTAYERKQKDLEALHNPYHK